MNWDEFNAAHTETVRFLARCRDLMPGSVEWENQRPKDTVKSAALRRASMDLTRALARLRRS